MSSKDEDHDLASPDPEMPLLHKELTDDEFCELGNRKRPYGEFIFDPSSLVDIALCDQYKGLLAKEFEEERETVKRRKKQDQETDTKEKERSRHRKSIDGEGELMYDVQRVVSRLLRNVEDLLKKKYDKEHRDGDDHLEKSSRSRDHIQEKRRESTDRNRHRDRHRHSHKHNHRHRHRDEKQDKSEKRPKSKEKNKERLGHKDVSAEAENVSKSSQQRSTSHKEKHKHHESKGLIRRPKASAENSLSPLAKKPLSSSSGASTPPQAVQVFAPQLSGLSFKIPKKKTPEQAALCKFKSILKKTPPSATTADLSGQADELEMDENTANNTSLNASLNGLDVVDNNVLTPSNAIDSDVNDNPDPPLEAKPLSARKVRFSIPNDKGMEFDVHRPLKRRNMERDSPKAILKHPLEPQLNMDLFSASPALALHPNKLKLDQVKKRAAETALSVDEDKSTDNEESEGIDVPSSNQSPAKLSSTTEPKCSEEKLVDTNGDPLMRRFKTAAERKIVIDTPKKKTAYSDPDVHLLFSPDIPKKTTPAHKL